LRLEGCDYLILTASNDSQAAFYRKQLEIRRQFGLLAGVDKTLVIPDVDGRRIGSGGSTLCCILAVLRRELGDKPFSDGQDLWEKAFRDKRVLIIHAGGDSKRLAIYSSCGKLFTPIPGQWDSPIPLTLFDKQLYQYLKLFGDECHCGQFIMTSGDVLLRFKTEPVKCRSKAVTGFCCPASSDQASRHGVFCLDAENKVRCYLQKPSLQQQKEYHALNSYHQAMLDIGIMAFDGAAASEMVKAFGLRYNQDGNVLFEGGMAKAIIERGLDFYRELCCVFGSETTKQMHRESAWNSGSTWPEELLGELFDKVRTIDFHAKPLAHCDFLDFGAINQIMNSGYSLVQENIQTIRISDCLSINNSISKKGAITGSPAWVEGCSIDAALKLEGNNIVTGVELKEDIELGMGQCLDVVAGRDEQGKAGFFVRCYGFHDDFKSNCSQHPKYCGIPIDDWLAAIQVSQEDVWDSSIDRNHRSLFNARLFAFIEDSRQAKNFLWMFTPGQADSAHVAQWKSLRRFSHEQIAFLTDTDRFLKKRLLNRVDELTDRVWFLFRPESALSDIELSYILSHGNHSIKFIQNAISLAYSCSRLESANREDVLVSSRILHSLGSALEQADWPEDQIGRLQSELKGALSPECAGWLQRLGISLSGDLSAGQWAATIQDSAFTLHSTAILETNSRRDLKPRSCLRADEIVWARAPARLDIAGGWTDTPPYALEWGGAVLNAAVNLNGQPPIQAYLRVTNEPVIKIGSIDLGLQVVIRSMEELSNYADVTSGFSLAKAALLQEAFWPEHFAGFADKAFERMLEAFGGGIELTTLAAIPKGSGLGTSSIMGAVIVAAINRAMGRELSNTELFNSVLKLEQILTTGGGWQDQIGGVLEGVKLILAEPGIVPNPSMQYLRKDLIDPMLNHGCTLLYYTGITRLAKNILQEIVGKYLNRDRYAMNTLKQIRQAALDGAAIMGKMDYVQFGRLLGKSWCLNKSLDPNSSNDRVEALFERISPHVYGAKLLGAGGGGFVLMACKSPHDARIIREELTSKPSESNARFFDYEISTQGLVVTVC